MEFLKIDYTTLEIYLKGENPSNDEDINDTSQFVSVAKIILEENPDILTEDLTMFIDRIKKIFSDKAEIIKNDLKLHNDSDTLKEFDECFIDDNILIKIDNFINKYNINDENTKIFGVLLNIITIIDYIIISVKEPELYNISKFFM
jgi:hypothetical protein